VLKPVIQAFAQPGAGVLDPLVGSGSTSVAAALTNRRYIAIELEQKYCQLAENRLAGLAGTWRTVREGRDQYTSSLRLANSRN
jgi:DNA modification methylase